MHDYVGNMRIKVRQGALYSLLKREGISRNELARRLGVSYATAYRIDEGMVDPSPKFIAALISVSGKKFEQLFEIVTEDAA
jgi:transcriptional regulator with XRE-family HTH domain